LMPFIVIILAAVPMTFVIVVVIHAFPYTIFITIALLVTEIMPSIGIPILSIFVAFLVVFTIATAINNIAVPIAKTFFISERASVA